MMEDALEKMRKEGVTVDPNWFWTSDPGENPSAWDRMAVRYLMKSLPVAKSLADGALKDGFDRLETMGLVELCVETGERCWRLTPDGRDLATVAEVMES